MSGFVKVTRDEAKMLSQLPSKKREAMLEEICKRRNTNKEEAE